MKTKLLISLCTTAIISACAATPQPSNTALPSSIENSQFASMSIDPAHNIDFSTAMPSDFGVAFSENFETTTHSYWVGSNPQTAIEVTVLQSINAGPALYVVGGVHGDEEAGWRTADLLKKITLKSGTLYILAPANQIGAAAVPMSRFITGEFDLNRHFPGTTRKNIAEETANDIFEDIKAKQPDFLLDLHEARVVKNDRDFLGSSLIFSDLGDHSTLLMDMILETQSGTLCSMPFDFFSPGPEGSINRTVSEQLLVPTITVETFRGFPIEQRIGDQLAIVKRVFEAFELA